MPEFRSKARSTAALILCAVALDAAPAVLRPEQFRHYAERFNRTFAEEVVNYIPDAKAWEFLQKTIPLFTCPDPSVEELYYYRWWAWRKHIRQIPGGFVLTEFLKPVRHATDYNAISCAFGHHVAEGRWLHDPEYLDAYARFWLQSGPGGGIQPKFHQFSGWAAAALYERYLVDGRREFLTSLLKPLQLDYESWEQERRLPSGLFWQTDVADGMEESISGARRMKNARPSINSYMYGNAKAIATIAAMSNLPDVVRKYESKAMELRSLVEERLWSKEDGFFETLLESGKLAGVREEIGFTPWRFHLPEPGHGYERAWAQLSDSKGFAAPYGPTSAEQRAPGFRIANSGDDCQWNGPSWPFSTSVTLSALGNVLRDYPQENVTRQDFFRTFLTYSRSQHLKRNDGTVVPFIDEDLNPFTGEWQARKRKLEQGTFYGRGDHYNHSTYADIVITGLAGLVPRADDVVEVNPLLPPYTWEWFCLDNVLYHGHTLTIVWDHSGKKFRKGRGLRVLEDGQEIASSLQFARLQARLR